MNEFQRQAPAEVPAYCQLCDELYLHPITSQIFTCGDCFDLMEEATVQYTAETIDSLLTDIETFLRKTDQ